MPDLATSVVYLEEAFSTATSGTAVQRLIEYQLTVRQSVDKYELQILKYYNILQYCKIQENLKNNVTNI